MQPSPPPSTAAPPLTLEPLSGPAIDRITLDPSRLSTLGRSPSCVVRLADQSVSRTHASVAQHAGAWTITDIESRHGVYLNGVRLASQQPAPLEAGDLIRIGPWTFGVQFGQLGRTNLLTTAVIDETGQRIERLPPSETSSIATRRRLEVLLDFAAQISAAIDEQALSDAVLAALIDGAGFPRAAFIRDLGGADHIELIGHRTRDGSPDAGSTFSRSLLREAGAGEIVQITDQMSMGAESIMRLGICSAMCAPVFVGDAIAAYLYLDARRHEGSVPQDAEAFCRAIARMCGMAMSNLQRIELERRRRELEADLHAAQRAQELIMPAPSGRVGSLRYAVRMRPGRYVAGDLFDLLPMPDGRVAALLGDVAGKGVGAAIMMTATQTRLGAALQRHGDPAEAIRDINAYLLSRTTMRNRFVTLWAGVIDGARNAVTFVDAGHGHWLYKPPGADARQIEHEGAMVVGISDEYPCNAETFIGEPGGRLILFSDGVLEQPGPDGEQFGLERAIDAVAHAKSCDDDVELLFDAVTRYAGSDALADDTTIASIELG